MPSSRREIKQTSAIRWRHRSIKGKEAFTSTIALQHDPRSKHTAADRALQQRRGAAPR